MNSTNNDSESNQGQKQLYAWGSGQFGQLGIGAEVLNVSIPTAVSVLSDEEIVSLTASGDVSAVITANGQIYTWGKTKVK